MTATDWNFSGWVNTGPSEPTPEPKAELEPSAKSIAELEKDQLPEHPPVATPTVSWVQLGEGKPWLCASTDTDRTSLMRVWIDERGTAWSTDGHILCAIPSFFDPDEITILPKGGLQYYAKSFGEWITKHRKAAKNGNTMLRIEPTGELRSLHLDMGIFPCSDADEYPNVKEVVRLAARDPVGPMRHPGTLYMGMNSDLVDLLGQALTPNGDTRFLTFAFNQDWHEGYYKTAIGVRGKLGYAVIMPARPDDGYESIFATLADICGTKP